MRKKKLPIGYTKPRKNRETIFINLSELELIIRTIIFNKSFIRDLRKVLGIKTARNNRF